MYIDPALGFIPCPICSSSCQSALNLGIIEPLHLWVSVRATCLHVEAGPPCSSATCCSSSTLVFCVFVQSCYFSQCFSVHSCISFGFCPCIPSFSVDVGALHSIVSCCLALSLIPACCVHLSLSLRYCQASAALLCFTLVLCVLPLVSLLASCHSVSFGPCILCVPWVHSAGTGPSRGYYRDPTWVPPPYLQWLWWRP